MTAAPIRLGVIDDHMVVQEGIRAMTAATPDIEFCGAATGSGDLEPLLRAAPDVLLLDLRLGSENGFEVCASIRGAYATIRILMFTAFGDPELLRASVRAGASGYVLKDVSTGRLPEIVRHAYEHGSYFDPRLAGELILAGVATESGAAARFSERELSIVRLIAAGKMNREIGRELNLSPSTVKSCISKLLRDLGVKRRSELVRVAYDRHLL